MTQAPEMEKAAALLPCPFCGSAEVSASVGQTGDGEPWRYIECESCGASAEPDEWNKRAPSLSLSDGVPAGWKLSPVEPTEEMAAAVLERTWLGEEPLDVTWEMVAEVLRVMLDAAPALPAPLSYTRQREEIARSICNGERCLADPEHVGTCFSCIAGADRILALPAPECRAGEIWPEPIVTNPDIAEPTGVPYIDSLLHRLLDAQQDINFEANERMSQSLCDASALIDEVETAIRQLSASPRSAEWWQPIETAPKDGSRVLLRFAGPFHDETEIGVTVGVWTGNTESWWLTCIWASSNAHREPTHWMPLTPAAPLVAEPEG